MERAGGQADLHLASVGFSPDHEVLARATADELFRFRGHKEGLFGVRLGKPGTPTHVTLIEDHEEEVTPPS